MNYFRWIKYCGIVLGLSALCLAVPAYAEIIPESFTVGPFMGVYRFDDAQRLKDSPVVGLRLGYLFTDRLGVEGTIDLPFANARQNSNAVGVNLYHLDALYHFRPNARLVPFIAGGVGMLSLEDAGVSLLANIGVGLKYALTTKVALRGDLREIIAFERDYGSRRLNNLEATVSIEYGWQRKKIVPPAVIPPPPPAMTTCPASSSVKMAAISSTSFG
jgi:OOP family OmpA-OmpF porin